MSHDDFVTRFISQLRASDIRALPIYGENAHRLADHLEMRISQPRNDGFDISETGNNEEDRRALAAWLEDAAHAGPFLAPSWGRHFSVALAWLLRNNHAIGARSVLLALFASVDPKVAKLINDVGVDAAYASLSTKSAKE